MALEHGVTFTPGDAFWLNGGESRALRLSFSSIPTEQIERGVQRLAEAIRAGQRRHSRTSAPERVTVPVV